MGPADAPGITISCDMSCDIGPPVDVPARVPVEVPIALPTAIAHTAFADPTHDMTSTHPSTSASVRRTEAENTENERMR